MKKKRMKNLVKVVEGLLFAMASFAFFFLFQGNFKKDVLDLFSQETVISAIEGYEETSDNSNLERIEEKEVIVAVIDTGIDVFHPDLINYMWINKGEIPGDGIDNDGNGYIDDVYGWDFYNQDNTVVHYDEIVTNTMAFIEDNDNHGTHIAGIIAAAIKEYEGVNSVINVKIMSLKINGGIEGNGKLSNAIKAIQYAQKMGATICNISWGTAVYSEELYKVMKASDMLFVAAAGNSGDNNDQAPIYPASFSLDNVISVASIDENSNLSNYSNYGVNSVDVAANGNNIYSTIIGGYAYMSGSSMAAPQVAAMAGIYQSNFKNLKPVEVKQILINQIRPIYQLASKIKYAGALEMKAVMVSLEELLEQREEKMVAQSEKVAEETREKTIPVEKNQSSMKAEEIEDNKEQDIEIILFKAEIEKYIEQGLKKEEFSIDIIYREEILPLEISSNKNLAFPYAEDDEYKQWHHYYMRA